VSTSKQDAEVLWLINEGGDTAPYSAEVKSPASRGKPRA